MRPSVFFTELDFSCGHHRLWTAALRRSSYTPRVTADQAFVLLTHTPDVDVSLCTIRLSSAIRTGQAKTGGCLLT